mmetsp:Transcript_43104/g.100628  ORF Transcript_43104/g.100628 Transcript_43104/m.100628 type:complete len:245 (+) Transcript_43104:1082-1816(+)
MVGDGLQGLLVLDVPLSEFQQEAVGHADERVARPGMEDVQHHAADQGWELATPDPKGGAHRGVAEHQMQVRANFVQEELEEGLPVIQIACKLCSIPNGREDVVVFLASKKIGDVATREHIIDENQEPFIRNLAVCQQKCLWSCWLHRGLLVEGLQVRLELRQAILLVHEDAQHFLAVDEAGEARQGLLAAPSHTHQQRTAAGVRGDAADATDVEHCIVEEHQVHRRMFRVVGCQLRLHCLPDLL